MAKEIGGGATSVTDQRYQAVSVQMAPPTSTTYRVGSHLPGMLPCAALCCLVLPCNLLHDAVIIIIIGTLITMIIQAVQT